MLRSKVIFKSMTGPDDTDVMMISVLQNQNLKNI